MLASLRTFLRALLRRSEFERDLDEEIRIHQEDRAEHLARTGLSRADAVRQARLEFGSVEARKEECRDAHGLGLAAGLWGDIRYACRGIRNRPGFAAVAIVTLAVAIGANTSMFTFLNAYLLRPFPVADPERNVRLTPVWANGFNDVWSYPDYSELRAHNSAFAEMYAGSSGMLMTLRDPAPRTVLVSVVSPNLFRLTSGRTILGRPLGPEDGDAAVLVLGHAAWMRLFGGDPGVIGRTLRLHRASCTIVGVAAPGYTGIELVAPDFWAPLAIAGRIAPKPDLLTNRERDWLMVGGVLKPGATLEQARDSFSALAPVLNAARPPQSAFRRVVAQRWNTVYLIDEHTKQAIALCFFVFGLLLLIACANLASLMMARATARHREMAVRMSIGASRFRLLRQLLTESVLLASIGGALGLLLTDATTAAVQRYLFGFLTRLGVSFQPIGPDWRVAGFATLLAVAAGVLFGFAPALTATESSLVTSIQQDRLARGLRPRRLRDALIVGEVTSSLVLLIAAGLFVRLGDRVARFDHGYDVARIIDIRLQGDRSALMQRLSSDSRFEALSEVYRSPLSGSLPQLPGLANGHALSLGYNYVDPRFFDTLGIAVLRGRTFTPAEARAQAPVAVVSDATARRLWPGADPLGRRFAVKASDRQSRFTPGEYEVIGVVRDVINGRLDQGPDYTLVYFPAAEGDPRNAGLLARVNRDPQMVLADLKEACFELGPAGSCAPMPLTDAAWLQRFPYVVTRDLACGVAGVALALVAIGLYGVVAFAAAQRRREIGIRMALGARAGTILRTLVAESWRRVLLGIGIGLPLCLAVAYAGSLHAHGEGLPLFDAAAYAVTTVFLIAVVSLATWLPARRAARIDPAIVLREE